MFNNFTIKFIEPTPTDALNYQSTKYGTLIVMSLLKQLKT